MNIKTMDGIITIKKLVYISPLLTASYFQNDDYDEFEAQEKADRDADHYLLERMI